MKIEFQKAKWSDYEEIHTVMQSSAHEISRKAYNKELLDTFDKFYIDKTKVYIKQTLDYDLADGIKNSGCDQCNKSKKEQILKSILHFILLASFERIIFKLLIFASSCSISSLQTNRQRPAPKVELEYQLKLHR